MLIASLLSLYACINLVAYTIMWHDKQQAIRSKRRIPETRLWSLAFLSGALGIYLGMKKPLYHKASKSAFRLGIPLLLMLQLLGVVYISYYLLK